MRRVKVKELEPGMVLMTDVRTHEGRLLLGAGCELADKHIKAFQAWGVPFAEIEGGSDPEQAIEMPIDPLLLEKVTLQVGERFRHTDTTHPFMCVLLDEIVRRQVLLESGGKADEA